MDDASAGDPKIGVATSKLLNRAMAYSHNVKIDQEVGQLNSKSNTLELTNAYYQVAIENLKQSVIGE